MVVGMAVNVNDKLNFRYKYIALLDIDEVIMPLKHTNWADMMEDAIKASLKVLHVQEGMTILI